MKTITREAAIEALRRRFLELTDDEHCMCSVAAELHVFCGGFSQWKSHELRQRYDWLLARNPRMTRAQLEDLANRWQLARQFVHDTPLSCDTQTMEHDTCRGWDGFTDEQLAEHMQQLCGEEVRVVAGGG